MHSCTCPRCVGSAGQVPGLRYIASSGGSPGEAPRYDISAGGHNRTGGQMLDWNTCAALERNPAKLSGAWVFKGTRVPVSALFSNLEGGATIDEFLEWFPGVKRDQVNTVLEHACRSLDACLPA